jgi:hypothetical protein
MLAKAVCLPKKQELKLYGDYNLKYGMGSGLMLDPKCLGTLDYNYNYCSEEETERFLELLGDDVGVQLEIFVQEIFLDYEDFENPLKSRQRRVYSTKIAYD